jgi:hypothetical protein
MKPYLATDWQEILEFNQLKDFESLWTLDADWFEEPNQRRGGWSGVSRILLTLPQGGEVAVFLKRQENHVRKNLAHPFSGIPTFRAELEGIRRLRELEIPTMEPVYYAERKDAIGWQCILITSELTGYQPLDKIIEHWHVQGWSKYLAERRSILLAAASVCAQLHKHHLVHRALHAKHLFVNLQTAAVCFIDLEKMRSSRSSRRAMLRDLDSLNRHVFHLSRSDRLRFLLAYFRKQEVTDEIRRAWRELAARQQRKTV